MDEVHIHLVPVLLGAGTRLIDNLGARHIRPWRLDGTESDMALHLRYARRSGKLIGCRGG